MRTVIVIATTPQRGLPHQERLLRSNPGKAIYIQYGVQDRFRSWKRYEAWRNADRLIRDWWLQTGRFIEFDRAVFVEWDVVLDANVDQIFPTPGDLVGKRVMEMNRDDWHWWREVRKLPAALRPHATGIEPLAVLALSRRCLEAVFSDAALLKVFSLDVMSELRLATVVRSLGLEIQGCPALSEVNWDKLGANVDPTHPGVWHPVKSAL